MQKFVRMCTSGLLSTAAILAASAPTHANAQEAGNQDDAAEGKTNALDDIAIITVTGTKKRDAENVQDVPLAVTAFNAQSLDALNLRDVQSLTYSAPNVSLDQVGTSRGVANFSIRGLGINSSIPSIDPTVGLFVDGVYLGTTTGVVVDMFDLDSVEILRGPQGVLFGRNVTGGAVLINTGNPTEDFSGKFRAAIDGPVDSGRGALNYTSSAVISGPIIADTLLFKLGAYYNKDEGYFKNLYDNSSHGKADTKILRGALEGRFGNLMLRGKLDYFKSDGDGPAAKSHGTYSRDNFDFAINERGYYQHKTWTGNITAEWDIGPGTLTNIFGRRTYKGRTFGDIDSSPAYRLHSKLWTNQSQTSNELRYAVSGKGFDVTLGAFYFDQYLNYTEHRDYSPAPMTEDYGGGLQDHTALGLFGQGQIYITDALSIIAGLRWSKETKDVVVSYIERRPECRMAGVVAEYLCPYTGTNPNTARAATPTSPAIPAGNNGFTDKKSWNSLSPKLGLQYQFDTDQFGTGQIYAHWTRGYRSGGYNFRINNGRVFENDTVPQNGGNYYFDEEKVDTYEIGGKYQSSDGSFTLNAAGYITKIGNMQREINLSSATVGVTQAIVNTADVTIAGAEAEARMRVSDSLLFTANIGIMDADYNRVRFDISGDGKIDEKDKALSLPRVPPITWGVGAIHETDLGTGSLISRVNFQYRDKYAYTDNNYGWIQDFMNLDFNITWNTMIKGLALSIYGKNMLDQVVVGGDTQLPWPGPLSNGVNRPFDKYPAAGTLSPLSKGRQLGGEITFSF